MSFVARDYTTTMERIILRECILLTARDYTTGHGARECILFTAHAHNNWAKGRVRARDTPMFTTPSKRGVELREAQRSGHYKVRNGPTWLQV